MDLERLKYTELRNLAKSLGLKAKGKTDKLIRDISKYYEENETTPSTDAIPDVSVNSTVSEDNEIVFSTNPVPTVTDAAEVADESIDEEIVFILNSAGQNDENNEHDKSAELENFEEKFVEIVEEVQNQSIEFEEQHPEETKSEVVDEEEEEVKEKLNTTFEIESEEKDAEGDDAMEEGGDQVDDKGEEEEEKENKTKEEVKGDAVHDLLDVMRPEMTDEEMKAELLAAIDKKVQNRKVTIMSPNASSSEFVSRIPTVSTANKTQPNDEKANLKGKDWQKIHEKLFSKQDPLDVYLEKKNKRMQKLNTPLKSAKRIAAESQKTAEKIQKRKGTQSTTKHSVQKPAQQSFIPKVISTKTMSLQFATTSTTVSSVNKSTRTPVASTNKNKLVKSSKKSPVKSAKKSPVKSSDSAKKTTKRSPAKTSKLPSTITSKLPSAKVSSIRSPLAKRPFSPYNFGNKSLNKSVTGTPNSAQKAKFDLKASLAKPITWKRHTGKLRPIAFGDVEPQYFKLGMNTSIGANRENRRAVTAKSRASKRDNLLNSRRNIK